MCVRVFRDEADPDTSVCSAYDHDFKYNYMCNFKHDLIGEGEGQEPGGGEQVSPEVTASRRDVPGEDRGDQRGQRDPFYVRREVCFGFIPTIDVKSYSLVPSIVGYTSFLSATYTYILTYIHIYIHSYSY